MDNTIIYALFALLLAFAAALVLGAPVIRVMKRLRARQVILHYVEGHKGKSGTPTMGGVIFIIAIVAGATVNFRGDMRLGLVAVAVMAGYGVIGFLDDFLKVRFKRNLGLRAYQKIIPQLLIAVIIAVFAYQSPYPGSELYIPFTGVTVDLRWGIIPFTVFIFAASSNSVNLTDGLDALASMVSLIYVAAFGVIMYIVCCDMARSGGDQAQLSELSNLIVLCGAGAGGLLGFLCFNAHPARIFMGDAGSMSLGGLIGALAVFSRLALLLPIMGVMFVASSLSVIIQVLYFKATGGKRVFLMAPLHHHFEKKGAHEVKIVAVYSIITLVISLVAILLYAL